MCFAGRRRTAPSAPSTAAPPPVAAPIPGAPVPPTVTPAPPVTAAVSPPPPRRKRRPAGGEPDLPANIPQPLYCPNIDEAPPEADIVLHCVLRPDLSASKVLLFYRGAGKETFSSAPATKLPAGWYRATIPGRVMEGRSLQYYLEARDSAGEPIANRDGLGWEH